MPGHRLFVVVPLVLASLVGLASPVHGQGEPDGGPVDPTDPAETTEATQPATDESFRGTLRFEGDPVAGVEVLATREGEDIALTMSDEDGTWAIPVPGPGVYDVTLVTESLPDGVDLRDPDRATLTVRVRQGQDKALIFALGERTGSRATNVERLTSLTVDGLKIGSIIALAAVGLSLIFGITGLINFAHGELVTFGALVAWFFNASTGGPGLALVSAAVIAVAAGGVLGSSLELGLWRSLRRRKTGRIQLFVISIGLALFLRHIFLVFYGPTSRPYRGYAVQDPLELGPISIPPRDLFIVVVALMVLAAIGILLQKTRMGTAMRAVADNRDLAEASGINVQRIILWTWVAGGALAALGGVFQGLSEAVRWNMGFNILLLMFAAVIVGGLGTAFGAMVGGLMIGLVIQLSTFWFSTEFKLAFALGALILVLLVRPQGILGERERVG